MIGVLLGVLPLLVQGDPPVSARLRADEARQKCAALLEGMDGVACVGMGGTGDQYCLLISVRDYAARERAQKALGGETYEGHKILWWVRPTVVEPPPVPVPPPPPAAPTVAEPKAAPPVASVYDCDVIRDHLKLKRISHPAGNGRSWVPCQVVKRTVEGSGVNPPPILFAKHRPDCPVYLGRVAQPPVSDAFVAWVYQQGVTVVTPAGTPQLSDLRPGLNPPYPPPSYPSYPGYVTSPHHPYITWVHTYRGWVPYRHHYYPYCRIRRW